MGSIDLVRNFAPLDTLVEQRLIIVLIARNDRFKRQLLAVASLSLLCHFHLLFLSVELSEVQPQVHLLRRNDRLVAAREQLEDLERTCLLLRGPILDEKGAWELERLVYCDLLYISLADRSFHLELLRLDGTLLAPLQLHLEGEGLVRVDLDLEGLHLDVEDCLVLPHSSNSFEHCWLAE